MTNKEFSPKSKVMYFIYEFVLQNITQYISNSLHIPYVKSESGVFEGLHAPQG